MYAELQQLVLGAAGWEQPEAGSRQGLSAAHGLVPIVLPLPSSIQGTRPTLAEMRGNSLQSAVQQRRAKRVIHTE